MRWWWWVALTLGVVAVAQAEVFRCVNRGGGVRYQDKPCVAEPPAKSPPAPAEAGANLRTCPAQIQAWREAEYERVRKRRPDPIPMPVCQPEVEQRLASDAAVAEGIEDMKRSLAEQERQAEERQRREAYRRSLEACARTPAHRAAIMERQVVLGMTDAEARCALDVSYKINRSVGVWGVHEQWVLNAQYSRGLRYLYFENGILTSVQAEATP